MSDPKDFLTTQTGTLLEKESEDRFWLNMGCLLYTSDAADE